MAEYIDREALFEEVKSLSVFLGGDNVFNKTSKESVLEMIDKQPTADVVEVVRCKDCRYCTPYEAANGLIFGKCDIAHHSGFMLDDYCSYGERKE